MVRRIALRSRPIGDRARGDVGLHADDRFHAGGEAGLIKFDRAVEVAVVGDGDRGHLHFGGFLHERLHPHRAVEERVFSVEMEVNELIGRHAPAL